MKASTILSTIALMASSALAAPTPAPIAQSGTPPPTDAFTFSLTNDMTGASASRWIQFNTFQPYILGEMFKGQENMIKNGKLTATSMQNIRPGVQGVSCVIKGNGRVIPISDKITSAQLDGVADRAVETDVTNFTIQCQK